MVAPDEIQDARIALGIVLASAREAAGFTQKRLGLATHYGRSSIANVETARQNVPRTFWVDCDMVLGTGAVLTEAYDSLEALVNERRRSEALSSAQAKMLGLPGLNRRSSLVVENPSTERSGISVLAAQRRDLRSEIVPSAGWDSPLSERPAGDSGMPRHDRVVLTIDERARELYIRGHGMLHGNQRREIENAQALLDRAVGRDPRLALAIADRGYTRWRQYFAGWTDKPDAALTGALRDVEAALAMDPESVAAHTTFIRACWDMGWHRRALQAGRFVFLNHPDSLDASIAYARALMNAGLAELALPLASSVLREDATNPSATKLTIWCQLLLGQHRQAVETAAPYMLANIGDANTRWAVALASANSAGGIEYASGVASDAVGADESDIMAWLLLGYIHRRRGDESAARQAWTQGISRIENDSLGVNHRTAAWAANIYAALKDRTAAMERISYLTQIDGDNGYIRYRLFHALAELGETQAAVDMLEAAVTCGFLSVQLMRQEETLAPFRIRSLDLYRRVARRLEGLVREVGEDHVRKLAL